MFNIEEFKSNFSGGARANRFEVEVAGLPTKAKFLFKGAQIPGADIGEVPFKYMGVEAKFAGDKTVEPWSVTMVLDEDFAGFNELEAWHNMIRDNQTAVGANNHAQYKKQAIITMFSQSGEAIARWKMHGLWPKTIPSTDLNWDTEGLVELQVTFLFDWRERVTF